MAKGTAFFQKIASGDDVLDRVQDNIKAAVAQINDATVAATSGGTPSGSADEVIDGQTRGFWRSQSHWYIDPDPASGLGGNDNNSGLSAGTPVRTMAVIRRRWDGMRIGIDTAGTVQVHVLSSSTSEDDGIITGFTTPIGNFGQGEHVALIGVPTPITASFTLTTGTAARSGNTRAQVVASGLGGTWTALDYVTTASRGRMLRTVAKTKHAWVAKDMGSLTAMVSRATNVLETPVDSPTNAAAPFASGDVVEVCSLLRWPHLRTDVQGLARPYCLEFNGSVEYARPVTMPTPNITHHVLCSYLGGAYFPSPSTKYLVNCCLPNSPILVQCIPQSCLFMGTVTVSNTAIDMNESIENTFQNATIGFVICLIGRTSILGVWDTPAVFLNAGQMSKIGIASIVGEGNTSQLVGANSGGEAFGCGNVTATTSAANPFVLNSTTHATVPQIDATAGGALYA